ncbi:MAG: LysR family transcriptional regulator [Cyanobacteria bacterium P01_G01_bin.54]
MDIATLQLFVEVMRQGSFAAVARNRNLDPSSVSRAIASLEKDLGIRLLQRTTRRLAPTEAGILYFQRLEPLLEDLQQARQLATDLDTHPTGTLRLTTSTAFGQTCIVPLLPDFTRQYPELNIDLLLTDAVVDLLGDRIDLAIRLGKLADSSLIAQRLISTRYHVCASPTYLEQHQPPQQPQDLQHHPCLCFPLPGFRSQWRFRDPDGQRLGVPIQGKVMISNAIALQQCAIAGMGVALLADWLIANDLAAGRLVDLFPDYAVTATDFNTAVWLVYPSRAYLPLKVQVFKNYLCEHFTKSVSRK